MVYKEITNEYEFAEWVKQSDSYNNNFSVDGAKAVQEHYEELSTELCENISFDPVAWCCEWSEYETIQEFNKSFFGDTTPDDYYTVDTLQDDTAVIEFDGGIIVREF